MRILFVTNNYTPYAGGVVSSIQATVTELQKRGHEILLVAPNFLGKKHTDPAWVKRVPSVLRFKHKKNHLAVPWRPRKFLSNLIDEFKPEVVHVHHPFLLGPMAVKLARKKGIKTVYTYHTVYEGYVHYVPLPQWAMRPVVKKIVLRFCRKVDHIIVPSSTIVAYLKKNGIAHTHLIPSGIKERYAQQPFIEKKIEPPYKLLFVGRFAREKNIPALFEVLKLLPSSYELILVGYGPSTEFLKKLVRSKYRHLADRIRFVIKPPQERLMDLYRESHLFLFPSQTDTQGLVMAEAMGSSIPVIALDGPGQRDIISGDNGMIASDISMMAEAIKEIIGNPKRYKAMQKSAWDTAKKYRVGPLINKLLDVYCEDSDCL